MAAIRVWTIGCKALLYFCRVWTCEDDLVWLELFEVQILRYQEWMPEVAHLQVNRRRIRVVEYEPCERRELPGCESGEIGKLICTHEKHPSSILSTRQGELETHQDRILESLARIPLSSR